MRSARVVVALVIGFVCGASGSLWAQDATTMVPTSVLGDILKEMEKVKRYVKRVDVSDEIEALEAKVDRVLENQTAIQKELDVIRVRASRKR